MAVKVYIDGEEYEVFAAFKDGKRIIAEKYGERIVDYRKGAEDGYILVDSDNNISTNYRGASALTKTNHTISKEGN